MLQEYLQCCGDRRGKDSLLVSNMLSSDADEEAPPPPPKPLKADPDGEVRIFKVTPVTKYSSLLKLLSTPVDAAVVVPIQFFRASNELIVLALIICWTITMTWTPDLAISHPARNYVGHFNPCFGWDFPPASYVAVFMSAIDVHLGLQYANTEAMRTRLLDTDGVTEWHEHFAILTAYLHAASSVLWLLLWSVGPPDGRWDIHLGIFSLCVSFRYLCALGNYLESKHCRDPHQRSLVELKHTVFVIVYGIVTALLPTLYFYDVLVYEAEERTGLDPPLPEWVLQSVDIAWMVCLAGSTRLAVPERNIFVTRRVLPFDKEFSTAAGGGNLQNLSGVQMKPPLTSEQRQQMASIKAEARAFMRAGQKGHALLKLKEYKALEREL
jgi:hypothetical protein|eukprot:Transcript_6405.p2 GENE.Transcript_6405~~Transcript_6405.p2  ORF type:complete len:382 (+),score=99.96 Transcript_6405:89-1234(+)